MAIIILCLWSPSPKHHYDHHRHRLDTLISIVASLSSRQLLLLRLSLLLSDKVKHYRVIVLHKIKRQPYGSYQLPITRLQTSHTIKYSIMSCPYHITTCPAKTSYMSSTLLLQVLRGCYGLSKNRSSLRIKTTTIVCQVSAILTFSRIGRSHTRFN